MHSHAVHTIGARPVLNNGIYQIPDASVVSVLGDTVSVQGLDVNDSPGPVVRVGTLPNDAPYFVDGRQHMKQNLNFLIRAADPDLPYMGVNWMIATSGAYNQSSTNFEEFSFLHHSSDSTSSDLENPSQFELDNLWPFAENYHLQDFILDTSTYTNLYPDDDPEDPENLENYIIPAFNFVPNFATNIPAPPVLDGASPYWIVQPEFLWLYNTGSPNSPSLVGVDVPDAGFFAGYTTSANLPSDTYNVFGLAYQTGCMIKEIWPISTNTLTFVTLAPGDTATLSPSEQTNGWHWTGYASQCPAPTLILSNYYFAPLINPGASPMNLPGSIPGDFNILQYPTPLEDDFNVTNQTPPLIIGAVGQPMIVGGWAKYAVSNSSPTKFAYLGQYFVTNAFLLNTSGVATTNVAGIVSPYGEFFPTQAGQAQLITMPDIDTGRQGTCTVSVVSLNVDANHDGTMDLTWNGQDQTSPSKPYVFWCNNNFDRTHYVDGSDIEQDDVPQWDKDTYNLDPGDDDAHYMVNGVRQIPCTRDLEDYSRLWINGVTSNLLAALPAGSSVTLNWGDIGNPNPGNPTIDLFQAADADGGIGYLTNSTTAATQTNIAQCPYVGRLAPGSNLVLNASTFANNWAGNYFIWCGVTNGSGQLSLTFKDGNGNVLGQATVWIQIQDIKQMYERWTVGDDTAQPPATTAINAAEDGRGSYEAPFLYGPATTNTPYILFVHGWNLPIWEKDRYAETAFKRLWWQGYQGQFGEFRWPTGDGFSGIISALTDARNYDNSEYQAWQSAIGLTNLLTRLNTEYPGQVYLMAHSMGNVVAGEALRLAKSQLVNTYIAMQGAVPAHCYDSSTVNRSSSGPPDCYAAYWTNGASCYFNGSAGADTYINFYNTNDWALAYWNTDQDPYKPDNSGTPFPGYYYTTPSGTHPSGFYKIIGSTDYDLYFPASTYEIFAYADRAWSYALGAQADVGGAFKKGSSYQEVNLPSVWPVDTHPHSTNNPYSEHVWHSAQFRSDNMSRAVFWNTLMNRMFP